MIQELILTPAERTHNGRASTKPHHRRPSQLAPFRVAQVLATHQIRHSIPPVGTQDRHFGFRTHRAYQGVRPGGPPGGGLPVLLKEFTTSSTCLCKAGDSVSIIPCLLATNLGKQSALWTSSHSSPVRT